MITASDDHCGTAEATEEFASNISIAWFGPERGANEEVFRVSLIFNRGIKFSWRIWRAQKVSDALTSGTATLSLELLHVLLCNLIVLKFALLIEDLALLYFLKEVLFFALVVINQSLSLCYFDLHPFAHNLAFLYLRCYLLTELVRLPEQLQTELHLLLLGHLWWRRVRERHLGLLLHLQLCFLLLIQ